MGWALQAEGSAWAKALRAECAGPGWGPAGGGICGIHERGPSRLCSPVSVGVGETNEGILSDPGGSPVLTWLAWSHSGKPPYLGG